MGAPVAGSVRAAAGHAAARVAGLPEPGELGFPLLVGASRKSFLGHLLGSGDPGRVAPPDRDAATAAVSALAAAAGAYCVRVHDVRSSLDAVRVAAAVIDGRLA